MRQFGTVCRATALCCLLLAAGCGRSVEPPGVSFAGIDFRGGDTVAVRLVLENPNAFTLKVRDVEYRVLIEGELCGAGRRTRPLALAPGASVEAEFPVKVDYGSIARVLPAVLRDTVTFSVGGTLSVPAFLGSRRLRFESESRVSVRAEIESLMKALSVEESRER